MAAVNVSTVEFMILGMQHTHTQQDFTTYTLHMSPLDDHIYTGMFSRQMPKHGL